MNIKVDELLAKLEKQKALHNETRKEIDDLIKKQTSYLENLIIELKPVYEWYYNQNFVFTHPSLTLRSGSGPILGFDEDEQEVIVLNIKEGRIQKVYLGNNDEKKPYGTYRLVKDGYYKTAIEGLKYLEVMLEEYLTRNNSALIKLKDELEEY